MADRTPLSAEELRRMAKYQAGLILDSNLNHWEPEELMAELSEDDFDYLVTEISAIATRLIRQGGGSTSRRV
jgi:hypothetical protein